MMLVRGLLGILLLMAAGDGLLTIGAGRPVHRDWLVRWPTALAAGIAFMATWSLLLAIAGVPASLIALLTPAIVIVVSGGVVARRAVSDGEPVLPRPVTASYPRPILIATGALVALSSGFAFHTALLRPVWAWDAWKIWSFKAKAIWSSGGFPERFFEGDWAGFAGYPPGIPFVEAWLAHVAGGWSDGVTKLLFPVLYLATIGLAAAGARHLVGIRGATLSTVLLAAAPLFTIHGSVAYTDLPLAFFLLVAAVLLLLHEKSGEKRLLIAAAIAAGFLGMIKNEGLPLYIIVSGVALIRRGVGIVPLWLVASLPFVLPWTIFEQATHIPDSPYHAIAFSGVADAAGRLALVGRKTVESLFLTGSWGIAGYAMIAVIIAGRVRSLPMIPATIFVGGLALFAVAYTLTDSIVFLENGTAYARNLLVLFPTAVVAASVALTTVKESKN